MEYKNTVYELIDNGYYEDIDDYENSKVINIKDWFSVVSVGIVWLLALPFMLLLETTFYVRDKIKGL